LYNFKRDLLVTKVLKKDIINFQIILKLLDEVSLNNNTSLILLRLKSYLISLIDSPSEGGDDLKFTLEFLERKYPDSKKKILEFLTGSKIFSDSEIAFSTNFKDLLVSAKSTGGSPDLLTMLEDFKIRADDLLLESIQSERIRKNRDEQIKQIIALLMNLGNEWINRVQIEDNIDDFSRLDEEEVLRPDEETILDSLSNKTSVSFTKISTLNLIYLKLFSDYLFANGGNISLKNFIEKLDKIRNDVDRKYKKLFDEHGLGNPGEE